MNINLNGVNKVVFTDRNDTHEIHRTSTPGCLFSSHDPCKACQKPSEWHSSPLPKSGVLCDEHAKDFILETALSGVSLEYKREQ